MMRGGLSIAICAGALAFGCTHKAADDAAGAGDDVAMPSRTTDEAPAPPPDPIPPPTVPQPTSGGDGTPAKPAARVFFGVDENGALVRFSEDDPSKVETTTITGLATNERVLGIDYRPSNGKLYALGSTSRLYVLDEASGTAVPLGGGKPFTPALSGQSFGFDFDPASDGARVHSDVDQDMVLDPDLGTVAGVDPQLFFAENDANAGQHVNVVGTAYTSGPLASLFAIDSTRDLLLGFDDAYSGRAKTVGALGVDTSEAAGFDITPDGIAYAALRTSDATGLYTIDLSTGAAKLVGKIGVTTGLHGLAIQPSK